MDPDCAICHAPASYDCGCESRGLDVAIQQAEDRIMRSVYHDIRSWVRCHARDYVLQFYELLKKRRRSAHLTLMDQMANESYSLYNAPPNPHQISEAQAALKRGLDEDWQASVQRYPEILDYFFSLVQLTLPSDHEAAVRDPPLSALNGSRKAALRAVEEGEGYQAPLQPVRRPVRSRVPPQQPAPYYGGY